MNSIGILQDVYHQRFPEDPEVDYQKLRIKILEKLDIDFET